MQTDKLLHATGGVGLGILAMLLTRSLPVALVVPAVVGAAKELQDLITKQGTPEVADAVYTAAGGVIGALIAWSLTQ